MMHVSGVRTRAHVCAHRRAAAASIHFAERPVPPPHPRLPCSSVRSFRSWVPRSKPLPFVEPAAPPTLSLFCFRGASTDQTCPPVSPTSTDPLCFLRPLLFPLPLRLLATWMNSRCNHERKPTTNKREKRVANTWTCQYSREYRCSILRSIGKVLGKLREEPNS